jgi:catechol 2,3-dioxygenase-like lactoylglutathione lyase family enzyme
MPQSGPAGGGQLLRSANVLLVRDLPASAAYYRDALGFAFDRYWGEPPDFCMVWRDGHCVMLSRPADPSVIRPIPTVHPAVWDGYFWVADVDALFAEFASRGARIAHEPFVKPYGVREGVVLDPDGHHLAFGQDME